MRDVLVVEVVLDRPGVLSVVGELVGRSVAEQVPVLSACVRSENAIKRSPLHEK